MGSVLMWMGLAPDHAIGRNLPAGGVFVFLQSGIMGDFARRLIFL
jgi:hypothetical protein